VIEKQGLLILKRVVYFREWKANNALWNIAGFFEQNFAT